MARRAVRVTLLLLLVAAFGGAAALIAREELAAGTLRSAALHVDVVTWRVLHDVSEARAGLQAYAVPGQDPAVWQEKVAAALASATNGVDELRDKVSDPGALNDLEAAVAALDALAQVDARSARLVGFDSRAQAGSLVFSDGLAAATTVTRRVEGARQAEHRATDRALLRHRQVQAASAGGAAALALLVALLLVRPESRPAAAASAEAHALAEAGVTAPEAQPIAVPDPGPAAPGTPVDAQGASDSQPLLAAADLCTDFGRLVESQEMPALLARSADLLDASGVIVWIVDGPRLHLRPLLAHGYTAQALARLPAIPRDADNATAAAYRRGQAEVVPSDGSSPGAIVAPILTGEGCVGVMAAEVRHGRETTGTASALARIVAAQLAALITPAPAQQAEPGGLERSAGAE